MRKLFAHGLCGFGPYAPTLAKTLIEATALPCLFPNSARGNAEQSCGAFNFSFDFFGDAHATGR